MKSAPLPLAYAVADDVGDCRRRVLSTIVWSACVLGGLILTLHGWSALGEAGVIPTDMRYSGWDPLVSVQQITEILCAIALVIGGIALGRGGTRALWAIRGATLLQTLVYFGLAAFNVAIHAGILPNQPAIRSQDCVYDALSRMTWVLGAPAVLFVFSLTLPANDRA